jgi:regulatory protein
LQSKLIVGQELSSAELERLQELAAADDLYEQALRYVALRLRSTWEMEGYLQRKGASPALAKSILNKLSNNGWLDDKKYAEAFVVDRQRLRPTSRRKIIFELRAKHIPEDIVKQVLSTDEDVEQDNLKTLIARKRQQARYRDDLKLMQYLSRQGFSYTDIKAALNGG